MFKEILPSELNKTAFEMIGKDWMLIASGNENSLNTMTASWGGMGVMWNKNVVFAFIRPSRYTFDFVNKHDYFSCSFFDESYRKMLSYMGTHSGRDTDKIKECALTPIFSEIVNYKTEDNCLNSSEVDTKDSALSSAPSSVPFFEQANTAIICKKLYAQPMNDKFFTDEKTKEKFGGEDFHYLYIGEIIKVLKK